MENNERANLEKLIKSNVELRRLYERHATLEERLSVFSKRVYLTPQEEAEQKRLKIEKLREKEKLMRALEGQMNARQEQAA